MKDIAKNNHSGLGWKRITIVVYFFALTTALIGLSGFKDVDAYWTSVINKNLGSEGNAVLTISVGAIILSIGWTALITFFSFLISWIAAKQAEWSWPRYFVYAFKFASENKSIVGWTRVNLNPINSIVYAEGYSFEVEADWDENKCVKWTSEIVSGGIFQDHATCYILYNLNPHQAQQQSRPYRHGLLRFRELKESDLQNANMPAPINSGEDQYFGHQQAIDKDGIFNLAYAESIRMTQETDVQILSFFKNELNTDRHRLCNILRELENNLKQSSSP